MTVYKLNINFVSIVSDVSSIKSNDAIFKKGIRINEKYVNLKSSMSSSLVKRLENSHILMIVNGHASFLLAALLGIEGLIGSIPH